METESVVIRPGGLARLIASENSLSDLWVMLVDLDPTPLAPTLALPEAEPFTVWREPKVKGGRLDIRIDGAHGRPLAAIEMKGASGIHGDQLERYRSWAESHLDAPALFYCAFDSGEEGESHGWTQLRLRDLFQPWTASSHSEAAFIARQVLAELDKWDIEADSDLGARTGYYVTDVATKRMARDIGTALAERIVTGTRCTATRDFAGSPMIIASADYPDDESGLGVRVGVDVRTPVRTSTENWAIRPFVAVHDESDLADARHEAFRVAWTLRHAMRAAGLSAALGRRGLETAATHIGGGKHDGFQKPVSSFDAASWKDRLGRSTGAYPRNGVFGFDRGTRLSTILTLDIHGLTRADVQRIVVESVDLMLAAAIAAK